MDERESLPWWTSLQAVAVPVAVLEFPSGTIAFVNDALAECLGASPSEVVGKDSLSLVPPAARAESEEVNAALARGTIDGFHAPRQILRPDGSPLALDVSGRRWESDGCVYVVWVFTPTVDRRVGEPPRHGALVLALTDHDWQISYVNHDAQLLGGAGPSLVGAPLLGLVHPSAATAFIAATSQAVASRVSATIATRLRCGDDQWTDRYCLLTPMCDHAPPRLGVVVTAVPTQSPDDSEGLISHVLHAARDTPTLSALHSLPVLARHPASRSLSARQLEILSQVLDGVSVEKIAASVYLSPSTVRNHLTAIYRKFGVHSRAELLAALLRDVE